jgi:hypothetical protein
MDKLLFPYAPVLWLDISEVGQLFYGIKRLPDLKHILLSFLLMISVSTPAAMWAIRSRDLEWIKEDWRFRVGLSDNKHKNLHVISVFTINFKM